MATTVGEVVIELRAKMEALAADMNRAKRVVSGGASDMQKAAESVSKYFSQVGVAAAKWSAGLAAAGVAASGALVKTAIDSADATNILAQKLGISTEALSKLEYSAKLSDVSQASLESGLKRLTKTLVDAQDPASKAAAALGGIGLSSRELLSLPADEQLGAIADALARVQNQSERAAIAQRVFGRSGVDLLPLLAEGSQGIRALGNELQQLGGVVDSSFAERASAFNDNLDRIATASRGLGFTIADELLGPMNGLGEEIIALASKRETAEGIAAFLRVIGEAALFTVNAFAMSVNGWRMLGQGLQSLAQDLAATNNGPAVGDLTRLQERLATVRASLREQERLGFGDSSVAAEHRAEIARLQERIRLSNELEAAQKQIASPTAAAAGVALEIDPQALPDRRRVVGSVSTSQNDPLAQLIDATTDARAAAFEKLWRLTQERANLTERQRKEIFAQLQERYIPRRQLDPAILAQFEADARYFEELDSGKAQKEQFDAAQSRLQAIRSRLDAEVTLGAKSQTAAQAELREETARLGQNLATELLPQLRQLIATFPQSENLEAWRQMVAQIETMQLAAARPTWVGGVQAALDDYLETAGDIFGRTQEVVANAFRGMEDALVQFVTTGKLSFSGLIDSILQDLARLMIQRAIIAPIADTLSGFLPSFGMSGGGGDTTLGGYTGGDMLGNAKGNVFETPSLHRYVNQVHDTPKFFQFARGGVFAEAGPEAIMPLARDSSGRLGVQASGARGGVSVEVHNYSGAQAETRESTDSRGNRRIEVIVGEMIAGEMTRPGSAVNYATRTSFGLRPQMIMR